MVIQIFQVRILFSFSFPQFSVLVKHISNVAKNVLDSSLKVLISDVITNYEFSMTEQLPANCFNVCVYYFPPEKIFQTFKIATFNTPLFWKGLNYQWNQCKVLV